MSVPLPELMARLRADRAKLLTEVTLAVARDGGYRARLRRGENRWLTLTRSTRPGVTWQVTFWEGDPEGPEAQPTGHLDITGGLEEATREMIGVVLR